MIYFIKGIYSDLFSRVFRMKETLRTKSYNPEIPKDFIPKTIDILNDLETEINQVIQSGDLEWDFLSNNNLTRYNSFYQRFLLIELFRFRVIENFGNPEVYLNKKINKIYEETGNLQNPPIVTTISNSEEYFWVHPSVEIIAVPIGEEQRLLNLPDLYHEIAHLIFKQYAEFFISQAKQEILKFYDLSYQNAIDSQGADDLFKTIKWCKENWLNNWIEEFSCDIIATYLVSCAYAWTNMKLTAISGVANEIYYPSPSHPSDEARNRAIIKTLQNLNCPDEKIDRINNTWKTFLGHISNDQPDYYDYFFPDELIDPLVSNIIQGCKDVYLYSYDDQKKNNHDPISQVLNDAWENALNNPDSYSKWEAEKIKKIDNDFDNNGNS